MKKKLIAMVVAICLLVFGVVGLGFLTWKQLGTSQSQTTQMTSTTQASSSEDKSKRPTEPNLSSIEEESIVRQADSEDDMAIKEDRNSKKTNQLPDVTDGKVLRNSTFDFKAIQKGDYSSVAGTWQDGYGNIIVLDKQGKITEDTRFQMKSLLHGILTGEYRSEDGYGATAQFIPAGIDASVTIADSYTIYDASDVSQDRIWLGDTWSSLADPYIYYYRVVENAGEAE